MSFLLGAPWGLLGLFSLPLIYFLHRYIIKGPERRVSSLALWTDLKKLSRDGGHPEKPPLTWVLLFELLSALFLTLWLSGLDFRLTPTFAKRIVVVLDASASMGEKGGPTSPLNQVVDRLREIDDQSKGVRYALVIARLSAEVRLDLDFDELVDEIRALPLTSPSWNLENALRAAEASLTGLDNLLIFSDDPKVSHPRVVRVGEAVDNTAFAEASWNAGEAPFVTIAQLGSSRSTTLHALADGEKLSEQQLDLSTQGEVPLQVPIDENVEVVEMFLPSDRLGIDDRVVLVRPEQRQVAVRVTDPRATVQQAVARALRAIPLLVEAGPESADLVIGEAPPSFFSWSLGGEGTGPATFQGQLQADPFSSLLEGLSTQGLIWSARTQQPRDRVQELLTSRSSALLWLDGKQLVSNIDLEKSNFLDHPAFPILMMNLGFAIDKRLGGLPRRNFRLGEVLSFPPRASWKGPSHVTFPSGATLQFPEGKTIALGALNEVGLHSLQIAGTKIPFAVNLLSREESDLSARKPPTKPPSVVAYAAPRERSGDWFRTLLLMCGGLSFAAATIALHRQQGELR